MNANKRELKTRADGAEPIGVDSHSFGGQNRRSPMSDKNALAVFENFKIRRA